MIPNHVLNELTPDARVTILSRGGETHFHLHRASDAPAPIVAFVASRERDIGGEG